MEDNRLLPTRISRTHHTVRSRKELDGSGLLALDIIIRIRNRRSQSHGSWSRSSTWRWSTRRLGSKVGLSPKENEPSHHISAPVPGRLVSTGKGSTLGRRPCLGLSDCPGGTWTSDVVTQGRNLRWAAMPLRRRRRTLGKGNRYRR